MLLEKSPIEDWTNIANPISVPIIADVLGISESDAQKRWSKWCREPKMGLETVILEAIIGGLCYDLLRHYGEKVWVSFLEEHVSSYLKDKDLPSALKKTIISAIRKVVKSKKLSEGEITHEQ